MEEVFNLSTEEYDNFLKCLSILKDLCNDVDIKSGFIRQRSNDVTSIFEIDLTSFIQDADFPISNLNQKISMLKGFSVSPEVQIKREGSSFLFKDQYSSYEVSCPSPDFMDNRFITEDELAKVFDIDEEKLILDYELSTTITDRIKMVSQSFNIVTIQVVFNGETITLEARSQAKDQYFKIIEGVISNKVIENSNLSLVITPFVIEHDSNIQFKMYELQDDVVVNKFTTDFGGANINIFTRASIKKEGI